MPRKGSKPQTKEHPGATAKARKGASSRQWMFRLAALTLVPLVLLGMLEGALRMAGAGYPTSFFLVESRDRGGRFLVENARFSWRFFPRTLARRPTPLRLASPKPAENYRVFVFGESAAMGDPDPAFSFSRVLQVLLEERYPGAGFEVINLAFTAINSHAVLPQARECAGHQGDLWVIYMGNNEVVGPFGPATVFGKSASGLGWIRTTLAVRKLRLAQVVSALAERSSPAPSDWQGIRMFLENQVPAGDPRLTRVYQNFEKNLEDILRTGTRAGARIVVSTVAGNLRDSAPFASVSDSGLSETQRQAWQEAFDQGQAEQAHGHHENALRFFEEALRIDPGHAELHYRKGHCLLGLDRPEEARRSLESARDSDALRFRADSSLNRIIRELGDQPERGVHLVDAERWLGEQTKDAIPGDEHFFDHVHFTFEGNYWLARGVAETVAGLLPPSITGRDRGGWADLERCVSRLGFSPWNRFQMHQTMYRRLSEPPFTGQIGHAERQQRLLATLAGLRSGLEPDQLDAAIAMNQKALAAAGQDFYLEENLAKLYHARGELPEAIQHIQEAVRLRPQNPAGYFNLGFFLSASGRQTEALEAFELALTRRPDYPEAHNALGELHLAMDNPAAAESAFQKALTFRPRFPEALVNLGNLRHRQGKSTEATRRYQEALEINPAFLPARLRLGDLLAESGDNLQAARHYAEAIRIRPGQVVPRFERAVERNPQDAVAHFFLANAQAAQDDLDGAIQSLKQAVELAPGFWEARYFLGLELATRDRLTEAVEQFREVVRLQPDFSRAHINLGVALARLQQFSEALPHFEAAATLEPENASVRQQLEAVRRLVNSRPQPAPQP